MIHPANDDLSTIEQCFFVAVSALAARAVYMGYGKKYKKIHEEEGGAGRDKT